MNITFIAQNVIVDGGSTASGSARSLHHLASRLANRGHSIDVMTITSQKNSVNEKLPYELHSIADISYRIKEKYDRVIPTILRNNEANTDIFHIFEPQLLPGASKYASKNNTKVVGRLNSFSLFCFNQAVMDGECQNNCHFNQKFRHYSGSIAKNIALVPSMIYSNARTSKLNAINTLFSQSPSVKKIYRDVGVTTPEMPVVPNMYDKQFANTSNGDPKQMTESSFNLLYTGRMVKHKGIDVLIKAMNYLPSEIHAHIVGDGYWHDHLVNLAKRKNINNVTFHGYIPHDKLPNYYEAVDAYVHPSTRPDPCPRSVLEALSFETPLIVSDVGGPPWMGGQACITFPRAKSKILAEKIESIYSDGKCYKKLEESAKRELKKFNPAKVLNSYEKNYERVLSG